MELVPQLPRVPGKSRINWTQTTTITVAAFIGCLAAVALMVYLFNSKLANGIKLRMNRVDLLEKQIDDLQTEFAYKLERNRKIPNSPPPAAKSKSDERRSDDDTDDDDTNGPTSSGTASEAQKSEGTASEAPEPQKGQQVATLPVV